MSFSPEVTALLKHYSHERAYDAGSTVIRRGDKGHAFYVILSGRLEVRLSANQTRHLTLTGLGPGDSFGEMALLSGEDVSADVVATEDSVLLECPEANFKAALSEHESVRNELMKRMALNIHNTSAEAWELFQKSETLKQVSRLEQHEEPLVAQSEIMQSIAAAIETLSKESCPVLITGDPGTGKLFAAKKIHEQGHSKEAPLFVIDCRYLEKHELEMFRFGGEKIGLFHLAHNGTLILRHIDRLIDPAKQAIDRYLEFQTKEGLKTHPKVRLIATTQKKADELIRADGPADVLFNHPHLKNLHMPLLIERKGDILPLARQFLSDLDESKTIRMTEEAEELLMSHRYRHRNAEELHEAIKLAVQFATDATIGSEHIFIGPRDRKVEVEYDLGRLPLIQWLTHSNALKYIRFGVLTVFFSIIGLCFVSADSFAGQMSNSMIWGFWEPAIIFSFLFLGHVWCTVCPISVVGKSSKRIKCLSKPPPLWIKRFGIWVAIAGFFLIIWSERVFHMTANPPATGFLFLAIAASAVIFSLVYKREVWCRYLCPLGMIATCYEYPSMLQVKADSDICSTTCKTHDCYKGNDISNGCPVFHHPLFVSKSHECKLCFNCLKICPHGSVKLYLRPPFQAIWVMDGLGRGLAPFALSVFLLSVVMLGVSSLGLNVSPVMTTVIMLAAVGVAILLNRHLHHLIFTESDPSQIGGYISRVAFALMILAWGPLMAYQLSNVPELATLHIQASPGSFLYEHLPAISLLKLLQIFFILLAYFFFAVSFRRIKRRAVNETIALNITGCRMLAALCIIYTITSILIVMG